MSDEDLKAILDVVSLHDRTLEDYILRGAEPPPNLVRGLKLLGLYPAR
ncbi:MAG: hypothetical protein GXO29_01330 [Thermotogae bacterium]|nr:hypothetical protein [Thermotogota bacterium]